MTDTQAARRSTDLPGATLGVLIIVVLIALTIWILRPFLGALVWALMIVVATWPVMRRLQAWLWGIDGYVHWLTVSPGEDPWFRFDGGGTALAYSGERFGAAGPIPSIRLKIQRNAVQDLTLLDSFKTRRPVAELRAEAARRFNGSRPEEWWNPRPPMADRSSLRRSSGWCR